MTRSIRLFLFATIVVSNSLTGIAQSLSSVDRENARMMARAVQKNILENYYDSSFNNIDLPKRFQKVDERLQTAQTWGEAFRIIAQAVLELGDSHTRFIPPSRSAKVDHGWEMQAIGESVFVVYVKEGSDAESKGLRPGDRLLAMNGITVERASFYQLSYLFHVLEPQAGFRLSIENSSGGMRELVVMGKVTQGARVLDLTGKISNIGIQELIVKAENRRVLLKNILHKLDAHTLYCRLKQFGDQEDVEEIIEEAEEFQNLILDLRGNSVGYETTLRFLVGALFDKEIPIATTRHRTEIDTVCSVHDSDLKFLGKLAVLIDHESASASEAAARVIQLHKRGVLVGDRTAGFVTLSLLYPNYIGINRVSLYGTAIGVAEVIMLDGNKLESVGAIPDELVLPTAVDMAAGRDPALARVAKIFGVDLDPVEACLISNMPWARVR